MLKCYIWGTERGLTAQIGFSVQICSFGDVNRLACSMEVYAGRRRIRRKQKKWRTRGVHEEKS
jgi:hypothetical protein